MNVRKTLAVFAGLSLGMIALSGCNTTASRVAGGTALGAATGAAVGAQSANAGKGALIGGGIGALGGFMYDQDQQEVQRSNRHPRPVYPPYYGPRG